MKPLAEAANVGNGDSLSVRFRQEAVKRDYLPPGSVRYVACCACAAGGGARARLCGYHGNQERAALLNGRECSTFPGGRERLAHALWGLGKRAPFRNSQEASPQTGFYAGAEAHLAPRLFTLAQAHKAALATSAVAARTLHPAG